MIEREFFVGTVLVCTSLIFFFISVRVFKIAETEKERQYWRVLGRIAFAAAVLCFCLTVLALAATALVLLLSRGIHR